MSDGVPPLTAYPASQRNLIETQQHENMKLRPAEAAERPERA